jgi:exosortase C (VPDSG-CTERM-specific)
VEPSSDITSAVSPTIDSSSESTARQRGMPFSRRAFVFVAVVVAITAAFAVPLFRLFSDVLGNDLNSYIVLVPFVALYLLYVERSRLVQVYESGAGWALLPLLTGSIILLCLVTGVIPIARLSSNDRLTLITLAYVCFIWSSGLLLLGKRWMASARFPMFFLIFLVPLPGLFVDWMETGLRLASAEAANVLFALTGTPAARSDTIFELPGITIQVAQECSGIRSSWVLFITSTVAAHLFLSKTWSRLILVGVVVPLGIIRNGFRIMVIGLLCVYVDPDLIHSVIHHRGGPIFFALSLIPFFLVLWLLRRRETQKPASNDVRGSVLAD